MLKVRWGGYILRSVVEAICVSANKSARSYLVWLFVDAVLTIDELGRNSDGVLWSHAERTRESFRNDGKQMFVLW